MAEKKEEKKPGGKAGAGKKKKNKSSLYEIKGGGIARKNRPCPKCGEGVFLANHKDRQACGKCGYAEWNEK